MRENVPRHGHHNTADSVKDGIFTSTMLNLSKRTLHPNLSHTTVHENSNQQLGTLIIPKESSNLQKKRNHF